MIYTVHQNHMDRGWSRWITVGACGRHTGSIILTLGVDNCCGTCRTFLLYPFVLKGCQRWASPTSSSHRSEWERSELELLASSSHLAPWYPFFNLFSWLLLSAPSSLVETAIVDQHPGIPNHSNDLAPGSILLQGIQLRKHCVKVHAPGTVDHLWLQQQKSQQQNGAEERQHRPCPLTTGKSNT